MFKEEQITNARSAIMGLVVSRLEGETVLIGDNITVTVTGFDRGGRRVRLRIDAPRDVLVIRGELAKGQQEGNDAHAT